MQEIHITLLYFTYLVTKTEHEFESGIKRHIKEPNVQFFVNAYHGVTGMAVTQSNKSVIIKLSKKLFRAERRRRFLTNANRTLPLPIIPINIRRP